MINATGVWADRIRPEEIHDEAEVPRIAPSRGTHVTVSMERAADRRGGLHRPRRRGADDLRPALVRAGADRDHRQRLRRRHRPRPARAATTSTTCSSAVNDFFGLDLGPDDLTGAYAGVRPLISTGDPRKSVDISRKAELYETSSGMLTITGGKLTTWRRMAKQVVDRMVEREGRVAPCRTDDIPLGMAASEHELDPPEGMAEGDLPAGYRELLAFRYGHAARNVLRLAGERPELARADRRRAARHARRGGDRGAARAGALGRRRAPAPNQARPGRGARPAQRRLGRGRSPRRWRAELGWDAARVRAEAERWPAEAEAEGIDPARHLSAGAERPPAAASGPG